MPEDPWIRYKPVQVLGQGGMGTVYLVESKTDKNDIKVLKQLRAVDKIEGYEQDQKEAVRLFKREAEILQALEHKGIVQFHEHYADDQGRYYLLMDFVPGKNLEVVLNAKGRFNNDLVVRIAIQCCEVLRYLHDREEPIIYRDLKPSNLMLTPEGRVVLIDFGIARQFIPKDVATRVITAGYSPPEQYFGRQDTRSDIYSLGATMSQLLTAFRPKPLTQSNPKTVNPQVLNSLNDLVQHMTAHEVEDRPPNAQAVLYQLWKIYKEIHPEWQMPEVPESERWEPPSPADEAMRQKRSPTAGRMPRNTPGAFASMKTGRTPPGSVPALKSSTDLPSYPTSGHHPRLAKANAENSVIEKVKRWFESIIRK